MNLKQLEADCRSVLKVNQRGSHTIPAAGSYPHQWLWDSCFIAIGLRHMSIKRAQAEILSMLEGQWSNGMIPNIIFAKGKKYRADRQLWFSKISPYAPDRTATSGITQPPMLAEAVVRIGEKLSLNERRLWYKEVYPSLLAYHTWLYDERDPHKEGLVLQIHPWETGLDNTPPWIMQLREHHRPWWLVAFQVLRLEHVVNMLRRDTRLVPAEQRASNIDALLYWDVIRRLKRKHYDINHILHRSLFLIEDLTFNSILVRANEHLETIAQTINAKLPDELLDAMHRSRVAIVGLWDEASQGYYSRDFITHTLIYEPSIATFMPLYSGAISKEHAAKLVARLKDHRHWWLHHPVPSVPLTSSFFNPVRYWQGPTWINTNWLIIDGLRRYGFDEEADELSLKTIEMAARSGLYEYFSPLDGEGLGIPNFSWSAALVLDLLKS